MFLVASIHHLQNGKGFLVFVLGMLFILTAYHFLLYFQQKDKSYLLYASYTLVLFLAYFTYTNSSFLSVLTAPIYPFFKMTHQFWVWLYNLIYFIFILHFLKFKSYFPKQHRMLLTSLAVLFIIGFVLCLHAVFIKNAIYLNRVYETFFTKAIIILTLWGFYLAIKVKEVTKHFILLGCFFLFLGSLFAILIIDFKLLTTNEATGFLIFYIAIILENLCFSLALGLKQKLIAVEKNKAQNLLIRQLKENDTLKEEINTQLTAKITALHQQIALQKEVENQKIIALKSQMNPHFIFNALNSIQLYIKKNDTQKASKYLSDFSKIIRKTLEFSSVNLITLEEELELAQLYFNIENTRFSNEIKFKLLIDKTLPKQQLKIPPLILQPFIENAIWHGLSLKKKDKQLEIRIGVTTNNILEINIIDNGIGRAASKTINSKKLLQKQSLGIQITKERLKRFHTNSSVLFIDLKSINNTVLGTKVVLRLPFVNIPISVN